MINKKITKSLKEKSQSKMEKTLEKLFEVEGSLHLGHEKRHRNPAMAGYLYGQRKGVGDIFNLQEFTRHLKRAYRFVEEIKNLDGVVILVAKDKSHYKLLKPLCNEITVSGSTKSVPILLEKWTPGLLTQGRISPKEVVGSSKRKDPSLIITFGSKLLQQIKREALITRTPLLAVVDSDQDPKDITYVIPCNDDSYRGQYLLSRVLLDPFFHIKAPK